jgi:hypothetical protein
MIDREGGIPVALDVEVGGAIYDAKQTATAESERSMGTMEGIPSPLSPSSVDVEMPLLDGRSPAAERSAATAPKV